MADVVESEDAEVAENTDEEDSVAVRETEDASDTEDLRMRPLAACTVFATKVRVLCPTVTEIPTAISMIPDSAL